MKQLTSEQIAQLERQGCVCRDWSNVWVAEDFGSWDAIVRVRFEGRVELEDMSGRTTVSEHRSLPAGVRDATLIDVHVGRDALIEQVSGYVSGYDIGAGCYISGVGVMAADGRSSFGNGVQVAVLNETGGREVTIYEGMSAQAAYLMALYGYRDTSVAELARARAESMSADRGAVGDGARVTGVTTIRDVRIGANAVLEGCLSLKNGTVASCAEAPTRVGHGVQASDFVISSGARVDSGAQLVRTFVGQGSVVAMGFSAHDLVLLANSVFENGEACAVMAGPYAVSMHKATLVIGALTSFSNFGSASNQSNHLYKLGPLHQGILERGAKTASNSYILFPAYVGAFTMVMGNHYDHPDTSALPFSYLIDTGGTSRLIPGINLTTSGTVRDGMKWPDRDNRPSDRALRQDLIRTDVLNPYTVSRLLEGLRVLRSWGQLPPNGKTYKGCVIVTKDAQRGEELYRMAIRKYLGGLVVDRLLEGLPLTADQTVGPVGKHWVDLAGWLVPQQQLDEILASRCSSIEQLDQKFRALDDAYRALEWNWALPEVLLQWGITADQPDARELRRIVEDWRLACVQFDERVVQDARKEFTDDLKVGFGFGAAPTDTSAAMQDFEHVRSTAGRHPFVAKIEAHTQQVECRAQAALEKIAF